VSQNKGNKCGLVHAGIYSTADRSKGELNYQESTVADRSKGNLLISNQETSPDACTSPERIQLQKRLEHSPESLVGQQVKVSPL